MELNLTKKQVTGLYKTVKSLDNQVNSLEKRLEIIRNKAFQLKNDENNKKQIDNFFKSLGKFSECLTSDLDSYDPETKNKIKKELTKLIHVIEDLIEKYLN